MGQDVTNQTRFCQIPQGSKKDTNRHLKSRRIFMAVGLTLILATTGLVVLQPPPAIPPLPPPLPLPLPTPLQLTPHSPLAIEGDANFSATALLEGWPGNGSPENPYIIDGLDIDFGGEVGNCICISSTRVSFTISNCNLTGAYYQMMVGGGDGICLDNVTNGELVYNTCNNNCVGINLIDSSSNTVANNTCNSNSNGIHLVLSNPYTASDYNTVANNTCNSNWGGISLYRSNHSIVTDNTCTNNTIGIKLYGSDFNMVVNNTCVGNTQADIIIDSSNTTVADNITTPLPWKLIAVGGGVVTVVIMLAIVFFRRR